MYNTNITPNLAEDLFDLFRVKMKSFSGLEITDYESEVFASKFIKVWKDEEFIAAIGYMPDTRQMDQVQLTIGDNEFTISNYELAKLLINLINTDEKTELITTLISTL